MKTQVRLFAAAAAMALLTSLPGTRVVAQQDADTVTVPFSDPSRIGKVTIQLFAGGMVVRGENRKDVAITTKRSERVVSPPGPSGLRRLSQSPGFAVDEERNEMKIESGPIGRRGDAPMEIRVPQRTNLKLGSVNGGNITVEGVEGEIEVQNVNGPVTLTNVAGSVVANSVNGGVTAKLTRVTPDKAMAFTSLNGPVDVTLPSNLKATLKMRSDQGEIFTDFDVQVRPASPAPAAGSRSGGRYRLEVNRSIYGTINGGGPEIELRSFNGTIYLRKGAQ